MQFRSLTSLTQSLAAALLSITPRSLRDWHEAPRNPDGSYNGPALVQYALKKLGGSGEFEDQRERLSAAQAEKVETENAVRRGQLAVMSDVEKVWQDHIAAARAKLLAIPAKLAPQIAGIHEPNIIAGAIRAEINAALSELADYEPPAAEPEPDPGVEAVEAAAGPDDKPVGRRRKKALKRE